MSSNNTEGNVYSDVSTSNSFPEVVDNLVDGWVKDKDSSAEQLQSTIAIDEDELKKNITHLLLQTAAKAQDQ